MISKRVVAAVCFSMTILSIINIVLSAELSHYGVRLAQLAKEETMLSQESEAITRAMVELDALTQLAQVAETEGYVPGTVSLSLTQLSSIAYKAE